MKPLATLNYVGNNKRKVLPSFICIAFSVFLVYLFSLLLSSCENDIRLCSVNMTEKGTAIMSNDKNAISEDMLKAIKGDSNTKSVIPIIADIGSFQYKTIMGGMSLDIYNVFSEDVQSLLASLELKITDGKMPEKGEILVPLKYAKQNKIKIGDIIENNPNIGAYLNKKYKVSGFIDGYTMVGIVSDSGNVSREEAFKNNVLYGIKDKNNDSLSKFLKNKAGNKINVIDYKTIKKDIDQLILSVNSLEFILNIVIILVLSISLGNLNYIGFINRKNEFEILYAVGYKRGFLYRKTVRENFLNSLAAFISGIIFTAGVVEMINISVWIPSGRYVEMFNFQDMLTAFMVPLLVSFISSVAPIKEIRSITVGN
ncbi:ABC transporter permease [Clostridium sp. 19966]|uniref:ABC transporter permease n=1 Tax=Clostridium sp. 19966 TaxID=2768166 RepID=UPI0028DF31F8|nr:ABC transporter permease [Clostridium sp. 19966]MDT8717585.1 ABC transporter permease [Clostridium sp. 19966]